MDVARKLRFTLKAIIGFVGCTLPFPNERVRFTSRFHWKSHPVSGRALLIADLPIRPWRMLKSVEVPRWDCPALRARHGVVCVSHRSLVRVNADFVEMVAAGRDDAFLVRANCVIVGRAHANPFYNSTHVL